MATVNLGRIKPVFRGAYSGSTAYVVDDIVTHGNESFICIQAHGAGTQATSQTAYWTKLAAKGTDGTDVGTTLTTQGDILYRDGSGLQRLGAGTNGQALLTGGTGANPSWGNVTSKILNVYHFSYDTNLSTSSNSYQTTSLTKTLTPQSATSDFLIQFSFGTQRVNGSSSTSQYVRLMKNNSELKVFGHGWMGYEQTGPGARGYPPGHFIYVDQPATTSAVTYSVEYKSETNGQTTGSEGNKTLIIWEIEGVS